MVLPACAGVILNEVKVPRESKRAPRMCGGDPYIVDYEIEDSECSPHVRGWSSQLYAFPAHLRVLPACAGVILYQNHDAGQEHAVIRKRFCKNSFRICVIVYIYRQNETSRQLLCICIDTFIKSGFVCKFRKFPVSEKAVFQNAGFFQKFQISEKAAFQNTGFFQKFQISEKAAFQNAGFFQKFQISEKAAFQATGFFQKFQISEKTVFQVPGFFQKSKISEKVAFQATGFF